LVLLQERGSLLLDLESKIQKQIQELYKAAIEWQQQQQQQQEEDKQSEMQASQEEVLFQYFEMQQIFLFFFGDICDAI
jgi:hypothetical protein